MNDASEYLGIRYTPGGVSHLGADCWGLVVLVYREVFGISLPETITEAEARDSMDWVEIKQNEIVFGDIILFRSHAAPAHVGIIVDKNRMLHVTEGMTSCVERFVSMQWSKRIVGFYRYVGSR